MSKRAADEMAVSSEQSVKRSKSEKPRQMLIDLHFDCLEPIFKRLEFKDLLTMAQVSGRFVPIVSSIFAKKYALIKITFWEYKTEKRADVLLLKEMPLIVPFLQYFGDSISNLIVRFDDEHSSQWLAIEQNILKFCSGLKNLELEKCRKGAFDSIEKPFQQLEVLSFISGHLGQTISNFNKWFPKLRHLTILHVNVANKYCIEETLPSLEHLDVKIGSASKKFSRGNIDEALRLNPQLRSIHLNNGMSRGVML